MQHRRLSFAYPEDFNPAWHRRLPELAAAANAVSMMMPHAEPFVAKSVRAAAEAFDTDNELLADEARVYVQQELEHHRQHQRFNEMVVAAYPKISRLDRFMGWTFDRLARRSLTFRLAFAAGFETVAYAGARWTDDRLHRLFDDAEPVASTLFLWHLAEEIEHKTVAFDVFRAHTCSVRFRTLRHLGGLASSAVLLALFTFLGTCSLLLAQRKFFSPRAHANLFMWSLSFIFEVMPLMAVSMLPSHHPRSLTDPSWLAQWLNHHDPETGEIPVWNSLGVDSPSASVLGAVAEASGLEADRVLDQASPLAEQPSGVTRVDDLFDLEELSRSVR